MPTTNDYLKEISAIVHATVKADAWDFSQVPNLAIKYGMCEKTIMNDLDHMVCRRRYTLSVYGKNERNPLNKYELRWDVGDKIHVAFRKGIYEIIELGGGTAPHYLVKSRISIDPPLRVYEHLVSRIPLVQGNSYE